MLIVVDSSAKLPTGLMNGNFFAMGDFDQCLSVKAPNRNITGQYCSVVISPSSKFSNKIAMLFDPVTFTNFVGMPKRYQTLDVIKFMRMTYGLCIPRSCSIAHLQQLWDYIEIMFRIPLHLHFKDILCDDLEKRFETYFHDKCIYTLFALYGTLLFAATFYDIFYKTETGNENNVLVCFSLYSNAKKLFSSSETSYTFVNYLGCISGLKFIGMLWVIYGHRVLLNMLSGTTNVVYIHKVWKFTTPGVLQTAAVLSVDMFFSFSGLLLSYGYFQYRSIVGKGRMNFIALHAYRLMRIWPGLIAMILFYISIFKHFGEGPFWNILATKMMHSCLVYGWSNLLFVNNYVDMYHQCMEQTWFLAVDFQLFLIAPFLLANLYRKPVKTSLCCLGVCLISAIYAFIITYRNGYGATYFEESAGYKEYIYLSTFVRMPPWMLGFVAGVILFHYRHIKLQKVTVICAWAMSFSMIVYLIMVHSTFMKDDYDPLRAALFNSAARPLWSTAILLMVFLCSTGHGGIINTFLSMKVFYIAVRMSYSVFLVHLAVIIYFAGSKRHAEYFSNMKIFRDLLSDLFFTSMAAVVCCLAFESPFIKLAKVLFKDEIGRQKAIEPQKKKK